MCLTQTLDPPHASAISQGYKQGKGEQKRSRTGVLSAPWSKDSLFSVRKTSLPQVFRSCGPHITQSPTDPTQIKKCAPRWPKHLLWPFVQIFWYKILLKRGRKYPRGKSAYFQGKPDKWHTCKQWNSNIFFSWPFFIQGNKGINGFGHRIHHSPWSTELQIYNFDRGA